MFAVALAAAASICSPTAKAADFFFEGVFHNDDDAQRILFSLAQTSTVTFRSYSYAGGTTDTGHVVAAGGFDPIFLLYDLTAGTGIDQQDDSAFAPADPVTGARFDIRYERELGPGDYAAYVTQYDNFGGGSLGTFVRTGQPGFTAVNCPGRDPLPGGDGLFCDISGAQRTGNWAVEITGVDVARDGNYVSAPAVPEPDTWAMMIGGFALVGARLRRRDRRAATSA
ncbi:DVUA0089 family protein [Sphingomonas sp. BK069]|uniref:DVUA0089 family protein n=1 Tax=Sphingomonas sp. BK069 TaxID=2586979 RepID=UPI001790B95D|nr:DVUA0089 family protein [Sphingomonas sp. BK069]MBB3346879.1 hypothetical protein [Sphingomonas sp. BK069]